LRTVTLTLEIVEGPGAGRQLRMDRPVVIGRDQDADLVIDDVQASRRHSRLEPSPHGVTVEDLRSTNGTFVNGHQLHGRVELGPDDELMIGVTVFQMRTAQDVQSFPTAVRPVPPALAAPETPPAYVEPAGHSGLAAGPGVPELAFLRDAQVKRKARLAPLAIFAVAALAVVIYLGVT
jgi:predicted component of type VI protein secretion system